MIKSNVEDINTVQRRISVTIQTDAVNKAFDSAYRKLQKNAKIKGFRPGKAPLTMIRRMYGQNVSAEVGESLVNKSLFEAIEKNGVKPIAPPYVETDTVPIPDSDYQFSAVVDVMPAISIGDSYKNLAINCKEYEVGSESCERELKSLARRQAKTSSIDDSEQTIENGLLITVSQNATIDGTKIASFSFDKQAFTLDEPHQMLRPEVLEAMPGMKVGEEKTIQVTLPSDFPDSALAEKTCQFTIQIDSLSKLEIPPVDDELAKDLGFETLAALEDTIKENLIRQAESMSRNELEQVLLSRLSEQVPFAVPPTIVDQVTDSLIDEMEIPDEGKAQAKKDAGLRKALRAQAKKKAQNTILLLEMIKQEDLSVSDDDIRAHIDKVTGKVGENGDAKDTDTAERMFNTIKDRVREDLLFQKAVLTLREAATITLEKSTI